MTTLTGTTFDLATAREQSVENLSSTSRWPMPRIGAWPGRAVERGVVRVPREDADLSLLTHHRELELIRDLEELPEVVALAAVDRAPTKVTTWVRRLAGNFHGFYHDLPDLGRGCGPALTQARLWLVEGRPGRLGHRVGPARRVGTRR